MNLSDSYDRFMIKELHQEVESPKQRYEKLQRMQKAERLCLRFQPLLQPLHLPSWTPKQPRQRSFAVWWWG